MPFFMMNALFADRHRTSGAVSDADLLRSFKITDEKIKELYPERWPRMGLKLFEIEGKQVWALNKRNACRKLGLQYEKKRKPHKYSNDYSNKY